MTEITKMHQAFLKMKKNVIENKLSVVVLGDVMLDHYIYGSAQRISPEAPIPVVTKNQEEYILGGAANVAHNLHKLGAKVNLISLIGEDESGKILKNQLGILGMRTGGLIEEKKCRTTKKTRVVSGHQQIVRIDDELNILITHDMRSKIIDKYVKALSTAHIVIISDYDKGFCEFNITRDIIQIANEKKIPVICDPKGKNYKKYEGSLLITPNLQEAHAAYTGDSESIDNEDLADFFRRNLNLSACLITLGDKGMVLSEDNKIFSVDALAREVSDVTGAGDTVIAVIALAVASNLNFSEAVMIANIAASLAVSKHGNACLFLDEIEESLNKNLNLANVSGCLHELDDLNFKVTRLRKLGKIIGFTNGCFDVLHAGHVDMLSKASNYCDVLVVGLNSDRSVKQLKGESRPINNLEDRARVLAGLKGVDFVISFDDPTPINLIEKICPDVLFKGSDYAIEEIVGSDFVSAQGGKVVQIPISFQISSTFIINKISKMN